MNIKKNIILIIFISVNLSHITAQVDVAPVGNSITAGYNSTDPYPNQLGIILGANYYVHSEFAHSSTTILKNGEDPYWLVPEHTLAISNPRDIVIITFGTNATRPINWDYHSGEFENDYLSLITEFQQWDNEYHETNFILGLPPPIYNDSTSWGVNNDVLKNEVIPKIKNVANQVGATIVDFYTPMQNHPEWFSSDEIHPNATGDSVMAKLVYDAIRKSIDPVPETPTGLRTIPGYNYITLIWNSNPEPDISGYHIFRTDDPDIYATYIGGVSDTSFTDNNVIIDKEYYYSIKALDRNNNSSPPTALVKGKTLDNTPPSVPKVVTAVQKPDTVYISWEFNTESDISYYNVYRNKDSLLVLEGNNLIGQANYTNNYYNDTDYNGSTYYYYGVSAIDVSNNQSAISTPTNILTLSRPTSSDTSLTVYEDVMYEFSKSDFPFYNESDYALEKIIFVDTINWGNFKYNDTDIDSTIICEDISKLTFQADSNDYGESYTYFNYKVIDSFGNTSLDTNTVIINVSSVNDEPTLDPIDDIDLIEDTHDISISISGISSGQINEVQILSIEVLPENLDLFTVSDIQYTSPDSSGIVILDPLENVFGTQPITMRIWDDGGDDNGGIDYTDETFNLYITPRNDPPSFDEPEIISIIEDIDTDIILNGIKAGPWESDQNISISVISNNTDLFPTPVLNYSSPSTTATLSFTTIPNVFGTASITLFMSDDGGQDLGGNDSTSYTIPVELVSVNDSPSEFSIITPSSDSTIVINKSNFESDFTISWETSEDVENDDIYYDVIFDDELSELSQFDLESPYAEFILKDILALTDTVSVITDSYSVIASDGELETTATNSGIELTIDGRSLAPVKLNLDQNFPNPFNGTTQIGFDLPKRSNITLIIYDLLGKEIIKLIDDKTYERGYNSVSWNGFDANSKHAPAGIYIVQIKMQHEIQHKKLILLK